MSTSLPERIGFIGTGTIAAAIVTGLRAGDSRTPSILLSPRNARIASDLASRFTNVTVAASNQDVLDGAEVILLAVRPQVAAEVLPALRFGHHHHVISLMALIPLKRLASLIGPVQRVIRAIPLPMVATCSGVTAIYPDDTVPTALFSRLGTVIPLDSPTHFDALSTSTAMLAPYFAFAGEVTDWLIRQHVPPETARPYVAAIFQSLATLAVNHPTQPFPVLSRAFATAGGINEQVAAHLARAGTLSTIAEALNSVLRRMTDARP